MKLSVSLFFVRTIIQEQRKRVEFFSTEQVNQSEH
jgi:hypothetical protein